MLKEIKTAIENDNLILFVGAGMSMSLGFPNWHSLIEKILVQLEEEHTESSLMNFQNYIKVLKNGSKSVFEILESIESNGYKKETKEILHKIISEVNFEGAELKNQRKLWEISNKIITTNYDKALDEVKPKGIEVFANDNTFQQVQSIKGKPFLYKIHGDITNPDTCILFKSDYEDLYKRDKSNKQTLQSFLQNKTLLFVGFSLEDPFITDQISYLYDLYNGYGNKHAIVLTSDKNFEKYHVKTHKVENWKEGFDSFLDELIAIKKAAKSTLPIALSKETATDVD